MANTTRGIPYPDDYSDAADVPATLQSLAATVDTLIGSVDTKATNAGTAAQSAATSASNAASAVANHTHNGSGSANIALTAVTGLSGALSGKADAGHTHAIYAAATHTHSSAELAAHTHADYSPSGHTHTQAQSHGSADTDSSTAAIHHTLGIGSNQAAPGNHVHSGYADTSHTHSGYAGSSHTHTEYSTSGHTHNGYAATSHNHDTAYATTGHTHDGFATTSHSHTFTSLNLNSITVSTATADFPGVYSNNTTGLDNVGITNVGRLRRLSSSQDIKYDIAAVTGLLDIAVDPERQTPVVTIDPQDVLDVAVAEFSLIDDGRPTERRLLGFIADDVAAKFPVAATRDEQGKPSGVLDTPIVAALLAIVKDQQRAIADLTSRVTALEEATQP